MSVQIRVLGGFSVHRDGEPVPPSAFGGRLARQLVGVLLTRRGAMVPTDVLVDALWPERPPSDPAANLKVLVSRARQALGDPSLIVTGTGGYALTATQDCMVDAEAFQAIAARAHDHLRAGRPSAALHDFRAALQQWTGDPLPEDTYADWATPWRQQLLTAYLEALEWAATAALEVHDATEAVSLAQQAVAAEPLRERANLLLVRGQAEAGDHAAAVASFHRWQRHLTEELGLDPSADALELERRLLRGEPLGPPPRRPAAVATLDELPFVGRDRELESIEAALRSARVAVVAGRSGAGKTRLLAEIQLRSGLPVVAVRAFPGARTQPWGLARALLTEVLRLDARAVRAVPNWALDPLSDVLPDIGDHGPIRSPVVADSRRALLLEGAIRLVGAATSAGALLVIDDLQWVDASSLELVALLHSRLDGNHLVVAYRPEEVDDGGAVASFLRDLRRTGPATPVLGLGPLDPDGVNYLVHDEDLAAVLRDGTDRTPLVVTEVLRKLVQERLVDRDGTGRWRPRSMDAVELAREVAQEGQERIVLARVQLLPALRRELLCLLALAGRETAAGILERALQTQRRQVLDGLEALAQLELVRLGERGWAPAHDSIAETIVGHLLREERARFHAMLATALQAEEADLAELAVHLAGAGEVEAAASAFADAAHHRLQHHANDEAEALAGRGLRLTSRSDTVAHLLEARAEARARRGELPGARADLREALSHRRDHAHRARNLSRLAAWALGAQDLERGAEMAEVALVEASRQPDAHAAALVVAAVADMNLGRTDRAAARYAEALEIFQQLGDARGIAQVVAAQAMATFMAGDLPAAVAAFRRGADLLEGAGDLLAAITPRSTCGHALTFMGRPDAALAETGAALELAQMLGNPDGHGMALANHSEALSGLGRVDDALAAASETVRIAEGIGHRVWMALALRALGVARQAAGDLAGAEEAFRRCRDASSVPLLMAWGSARLALVLVARGELDEAAGHIESVLGDSPPLAWYEGRLAQAELAAARHDRDAEVVAHRALELARAGGHLASAARLEELATSRGSRVATS